MVRPFEKRKRQSLFINNKNPDDPDAHANFIKINRAYEVLKDEELRKKYDQFGEAGLKDDFQGGNQYQSWQFYRDNFGIYDDDPEIVTLSRADFQQAVVDSGDLWFINFYSTFCGHCHQLAPTWRELARQMEGVIRIGAVNCAEDPMLCQSHQVMGYPSLVAFPERLFYQGPRELNKLVEFIMSKLNVEMHRVTFKNFEALSTEWVKYAGKPWVIDFCDDEEYCLSKINRRKLAAMLDGLANIGTVKCPEVQRDLLCKKIRNSGVAFFPTGQINKEHEYELSSLDPKEIYNEVLSIMPDIIEISQQQYQELLEQSENGLEIPTIIRFIKESESSMDQNQERELKKLPNMFPDIKFYTADCAKLEDGCAQFHIDTYPKFVMFKTSGGYEINYSKKQSVHDIAAFIRESFDSHLNSLTDEQYTNALLSESEDELWIIDYFAPWCPPCLKLIPELRSIPDNLAGLKIHTGTLDCVGHKEICQKAGIGSYPTTIMYYKGHEHKNVGYHSTEEIVEFINDILNPSVEELNFETFTNQVINREEGRVWVVDFFAPWCGPCQQLAPEYRKMARAMRETNDKVSFGSVDCDAHRNLCVQQGINTYPTIRLFSGKLTNKAVDYPSNWWRDAGSMKKWVTEWLPSLVEKLGHEFYQEVLGSTEPWLVDFYAPWCGHCVQFAPSFEQVAKMLEGKVRLAKIDCDQYPGACQTAQVRAYPSVRLYVGASHQGQRQEATGIPIQSQHPETIVNFIKQTLRQHKKRFEDEL
uniref:DnaJ homolog subfamily C member 10 n=1 Tax=Acrobeloides nanus TaxID=290746 RepID=A0A914C2D7_9BILA